MLNLNRLPESKEMGLFGNVLLRCILFASWFMNMNCSCQMFVNATLKYIMRK